ncbi:MAG: Ppx/GppA family phosphatase [Myxococcota bacterium]
MNRAAIDIGSNSLLLTVVAPDGRILHDEAQVVGLGKGLGDRGMFRTDRMEAAEAVLAAYVHTAGALGVDPRHIKAVATSGARRAMNAETWFERVRHRIGLQIVTVSGDEEARLTWLGAQRDLSLPPEVIRLVVDLGGGSTELALGTGSSAAGRVSLELGTVRLTEAHLCGGPGAAGVPDRYDPTGREALEDEVDRALTRAPLTPRPSVVIGVAGTATTLAAMHLGLERYDGAAVHGAQVPRRALQQAADALFGATSRERASIARVSPERADFLAAGAVVLERVLGAAGVDTLTVSDRGLRFALVG